MSPKHRTAQSASHQLLPTLTRRRFLRNTTAAATGILLANCSRNLSSPNHQSPTASGDDAKTLRIFTWANYTDPKLLKDFQDKTGITVVIDTYDSNETMLAKFQAGGGNGYSITYPGDYMVPQMVNLGMLTPLDHSRLKGLDRLQKKWQDPSYDRGNRYTVPTNWGSTGLIYDATKMQPPIKGWRDLWENVDSLSRKVTLVNDVREVMGATLLALGYSFNSTNPKEIEAAYNQLVEFKPAIASFVTNGWEERLVSGDLQVSMGYSQDAMALIAEHPNLTYILPETGGSVWSDTVAIPKTAPNPDAAYEWINFLLEPSTAKYLTEQLNLATPNQVALNSLSEQVKNNKTLFPDEAALSKCETPMPVPAETVKLIDQYWTQLTSA
jgi:spermidine/putrescine transport system substrate-binding protein